MKRKDYKIISQIQQGLLLFVMAVFSLQIKAQAIYTFSYTGAQQTISIGPGTFSIQAWGGDGYTQTTGFNGRAGYASGILTLVSTQTISVYVGGLGGYPASSVNANTWTLMVVASVIRLLTIIMVMGVGHLMSGQLVVLGIILKNLLKKE